MLQNNERSLYNEGMKQKAPTCALTPAGAQSRTTEAMLRPFTFSIRLRRADSKENPHDLFRLRRRMPEVWPKP